MGNLNKTLFAMSLALGGVMSASIVMPTSAHADDSEQVKAKSDKGMAEYDGMEFEAAKGLLMEAIAIGERTDSKGIELATAYLNLGIVYFSGFGEEEKASEAFTNALGVDSTVTLGVAYSTPEMAAVFEDARGKISEGGDCSISGLAHELVDEAAAGSSPEMRARLGEGVLATSVMLFFRGEGQLEFSKVALKKSGACEYVGSIPTTAVQGDFVHYYIAALDSDGKEIEHKGTSGSPNIIEVLEASGGSNVDGDNPLASGGNKDDESLLSTESGPSVFLSVGIGSGAGYIQGPTEKSKSEVACCIAPALLHLFPEIGYFISNQLSISAAFRMGFPLGANIEGHATFAPAGLLRVRYALSTSGEGIQVSGALGGGMMRNTVEIEDPEVSDMNVDTTVMGPVIFGAGVGYVKSLGGPIRLVAEVNVLAAVTAGIDELGSARPKNGAQADANLALLFAF